MFRFDDWVPFLGMDAVRSSDGRWRGKAIWKGAENANVGFRRRVLGTGAQRRG